MEAAEASSDTDLMSMADSLLERAKLVVETGHVDPSFTVSAWSGRSSPCVGGGAAAGGARRRAAQRLFALACCRLLYNAPA